MKQAVLLYNRWKTAKGGHSRTEPRVREPDTAREIYVQQKMKTTQLGARDNRSQKDTNRRMDVRDNGKAGFIRRHQTGS